jgi:hypothetical protein
MKKYGFFFLFSSYLLAADSLVDALLDGNITHKMYATYNEGSAEEEVLRSRTQKVLFSYATAPVGGFGVEVSTQSFTQESQQNKTDNTIYYSKARYQGGDEAFRYDLSANYYADTYQDMNEKMLDTTDAVGLKAQMQIDGFSTYVAYSKVLSGTRGAQADLYGKDHLLPTSSVLSSNNYTPNTQAYAIDVNYALQKDFLLGSRYVIANEAQSTLSYTGVYSDFKLDEISKGLNIGLAYDKTGLAKQNDQFRLQIKSTF